MADQTRSNPSSGSTSRPGGYEEGLGAKPVAPGEANSAWGRTSADLATDRPAGHAAPDLQSDAGNPPGTHDVTRDWGPTAVDTDTGGDIRKGRDRKLQPEIDPDTRLGLHPVTSGDDLPNPPRDVETDVRTRVATGAVAGTIASAVLAALVYALFFAGVAGVPSFVGVERAMFGVNGTIDHVIGLLGFLIVGSLWGALFGLMVKRPSLVKGVAFGLLPTLVDWLVTAPLTGHGLFNRGTAAGIALPLLYHCLIWGSVVGHLCGRWLRPPYSAATSPTTGGDPSRV